MDRKYKSEILQVIHEEAVANFRVGGISEDRMRYYDEKCLVSETLSVQSAGLEMPVYAKEFHSAFCKTDAQS